MKKIITAGHICIDITPVFPADRDYGSIADLLVPGKLINMEAADVHTGGSVANVGLALKKLGCDVQLMGKVGNDAFAAMIEGILAKHGVGGLLVDEHSSTSYSVVLAVPGIDRVFLHNPGANDSFSNADIPEEALDGAALFHFGYPPIMRKMFENDGDELVAIFRRVKGKGIATSLDLAAVDPDSQAGRADWEKILSRVLSYVDFFVPSFEELCFMLDRPRYNTLCSRGGDMTEGLDIDEHVKPLADKLMAMGGKVVLIKCGTSGIYYRTADEARLSEVGANLGLDCRLWADKEGHEKCFVPEIVRSATGAGDTSIAAFLTAVMQGRGPKESVTLACAEGACCVTAYDALSGLKGLDELEGLIGTWERK